MMKSTNPATGEVIATYQQMESEEVKQIVEEADRRFREWRKTPIQERCQLLSKAAEVLRRNKPKYAELMTSEMGKRLSEAESEVEKCAWVCDYYAQNGESFLADEAIETEMSRSFLTYQPLGVVLAVMPWNFPFWQVFRFLAPTLTAGNAGLLKHASNVTGCALAIEEILTEAGYPDGLFRTLRLSSSKMDQVLENELVRAVTLTGSVPAGEAVAERAGRLLKKTVLELGGSDPYLVLADADLQLAAEKCAFSRLLNAGQSCIAAKRFLVVEECYEEFLKLFTEEMEKRTLGVPTDDETGLGPQASLEFRDQLQKQVEAAVEAGAKIHLGGEIPDREGAYYPATILVNVSPDNPAFQEEIFGPVASVTKVKSEAEAIELANRSEFGLGGAVFTQDLERGLAIAREQIEVGCCAVNDFVKSNPKLPFGGIKKSGYGRELSHLGIREFVNIKTVTLP